MFFKLLNVKGQKFEFSMVLVTKTKNPYSWTSNFVTIGRPSGGAIRYNFWLITDACYSNDLDN